MLLHKGDRRPFRAVFCEDDQVKPLAFQPLAFPDVVIDVAELLKR